MPVVVSLRIEELVLDLVTSEVLDVGRIFEVDSISLLLGKNGSGKTRLLNLIGEAVSAPGYYGSMVYVKSREGEISILSEDAGEICAIYYSGLPYRRRLKRRSGLIDASPTNYSTRFSQDHGRMQQLGDVATALGVNTQLTARLSYSKNIHRSIIVPVLKRAKYLESSVLRNLISSLKRLESTSFKDPDTLKDLNSQIDEAYQDIVEFLDEYIGSHLAGKDYIFYLSVLESLSAQEEYDGSKCVLAFLDYLGLVSASFPVEFDVVQDLVDRSREVIRTYGGRVTFTERSVSFLIDGISEFNAVRQYDTPIKIEWAALSSGLQALIDQFAYIGEAVRRAVSRGRDSILLMIDEGDAYLHLDWQRKYLTLLNKYLGRLKRSHGLRSLQVILASHSPLVAADMPGLFVTNLDSKSRIKTFGAPIEDVISGSFESSSLGEFAAKKINEIYDRVRRNKLSSADKKLIDEIGDEAIRSALMRGRRS